MPVTDTTVSILDESNLAAEDVTQRDPLEGYSRNYHLASWDVSKVRGCDDITEAITKLVGTVPTLAAICSAWLCEAHGITPMTHLDAGASPLRELIFGKRIPCNYINPHMFEASHLYERAYISTLPLMQYTAYYSRLPRHIEPITALMRDPSKPQTLQRKYIDVRNENFIFTTLVYTYREEYDIVDVNYTLEVAYLDRHNKPRRWSERIVPHSIRPVTFEYEYHIRGHAPCPYSNTLTVECMHIVDGGT